MLRARFSKTGDAIWMSHLDLMRVLQRSFRRAGLLLAHSHGYTPHPNLSLALPLSVGVSSTCEIMDFELEEGQDAADLAARLNRVLPAGVEIAEVYEGEMKVKHLKWLRIALTMEYDKGVPAGAAEAIEALFGRDELLFEKKTKSGAVVTQNILEMMKELNVSQQDGHTLRLACLISAQDPALNPARIVDAIERELPEYAPDFSSVCREAILTEDGAAFR